MKAVSNNQNVSGSTDNRGLPPNYQADACMAAAINGGLQWLQTLGNVSLTLSQLKAAEMTSLNNVSKKIAAAEALSQMYAKYDGSKTYKQFGSAYAKSISKAKSSDAAHGKKLTQASAFSIAKDFINSEVGVGESWTSSQVKQFLSGMNNIISNRGGFTSYGAMATALSTNLNNLTTQYTNIKTATTDAVETIIDEVNQNFSQAIAGLSSELSMIPDVIAS